ncbi:MAG: hypothetical protein ACYTEZ_19095 [Planctomycetota bacterium]|jgi:hypothetical protein
MRPILTALLLAVACKSPAPEPVPDEEFVVVAEVFGSDTIAQTHVLNLLAREGIESYVEGSVYYGVFVPKKDKRRATEILRREAGRNEHHIEFGIANPPVPLTEPEPQWRELAVRGPHKDVIQRKDLPVEVRALLRDARVVQSLDRWPYVFKIRVLPRRYLDGDGKTRTGYDVELEMSADPEAKLGLKRINYQVLAGGLGVSSASSSSWGGLDCGR